MAVIFPGGRGNCYQINRYLCGVPGCATEEFVEEVIPHGDPPLDPEAGPDGWRLLQNMWICPNHEILVEIDGGGWDALRMMPGSTHWERTE